MRRRVGLDMVSRCEVSLKAGLVDTVSSIARQHVKRVNSDRGGEHVDRAGISGSLLDPGKSTDRRDSSHAPSPWPRWTHGADPRRLAASGNQRPTAPCPW